MISFRLELKQIIAVETVSMSVLQNSNQFKLLNVLKCSCATVAVEALRELKSVSNTQEAVYQLKVHYCNEPVFIISRTAENISAANLKVFTENCCPFIKATLCNFLTKKKTSFNIILIVWCIVMGLAVSLSQPPSHHLFLHYVSSMRG